jgi:hypothetical protein
VQCRVVLERRRILNHTGIEGSILHDIKMLFFNHAHCRLNSWQQRLLQEQNGLEPVKNVHSYMLKNCCHFRCVLSTAILYTSLMRRVCGSANCFVWQWLNRDRQSTQAYRHECWFNIMILQVLLYMLAHLVAFCY